MSTAAPEGNQKLRLLVAAGAVAVGIAAVAVHALRAPEATAPPPAASEPKPKAAAPKLDLARPETIAVAYLLPGEAGDARITLNEGKLSLRLGPPTVYPLEPAGERRYTIGGPMPAGYAVSVRPATGNADHFELVIERPSGPLVLVPRDAAAPTGAQGKHAELQGVYRAMSGSEARAIAFSGGRLVLVALGKPAEALKETAGDTFALEAAGAAPGVLRVRREGERVIGIVVERDGARLELARPDTAMGGLSAAEIRTRSIAGLGGEAALKALRSLSADVSVTTEGKGITAKGKLHWRAPDAVATELTSYTQGREGVRRRLVLRGADAGAASGEQPLARVPREAGASIKAQSPMPMDLDWQAAYPTITVRQTYRAGGDELIAVEKVSAEGVRLTDHYDTKAYLLRRRDVTVSGPGGEIVVTTTFEDYRAVEGVMIPMLRTTSLPGMLAQQMQLAEVRANAEIPDAVFELK